MTTTTTIAQSIQPAAPSDVAAITRTLAGAFQDDPVFGWCIPDAPRRAEVLAGFFDLATRIVVPLGSSEVAAGAASAALWVPPGTPAVPAERADEFEAAVADLVGADAERVFAIIAMLDANHPADEHHFLWFLGTLPHRQGTGLGGALIDAHLARCDRDGAAAYLDATSPENRRLYERHGFEIVAERSADGSPPLWAMWRDPR